MANITKEHILKVCTALFLQKGFKEVTMKEIVEKTGMSKGAIYHYFNSKEQLFLEVINTTITSAFDSHLSKTNYKSLNQFYHEFIEQITESTFLKNETGNKISLNYFSLIFDALKIFPSFQNKMFEYQQIQLNFWKNIISSARANGEIKSSINDEQIANMFIHSSDGAVMYNIFINSSNEETRDYLLDIWDSFYAILKN
ncbi:TetR/AcrR family transcriptional regulator [Methanobacterium sp.]|uniref:TetR/AcrR family transcriptional regulator n=1 Tax=Methanobacterium sp. TaxID=2164 RepID=UPI003C7444F6